MPPRLAALVAAACLGAVAAPARADLVRGDPDRDHVVVERDNQVWRSLDGAPREPIALPPGYRVLDALPDRSGATWIAIAPVPRFGPARLGLVVPGDETVWREIPDTENIGRLHLVPRRGGTPHLVASSGAWRALDRGGARRIATWSVDDYGFYAASARVGPDGAVTLLAPTFNTCQSADRLEALVEVRARGGRVTSRDWAAERLGYTAPALTADGTIYRWFRDARDTCTLEIGSHASSATDGDACTVLVRHDGVRTVAVVDDDRVVRLGRPGRRPGPSSTIELGHLGPDDVAVDVSPDHRGGALVLLADGRVVRFAGGAGRALPL
jgi:hypothetical protein